MIQLGAKYLRQSATQKEKDFSPSLNLVLFEEPEAFLHPPQQDELARNLIGMSEAEDWQVICSTHSAHFVSRNAARIPSIVRAHRVSGIVRVFQADQAEWEKIIDANQAIQKIAEKFPKLKMGNEDLEPEMEAIRYFLWLNPDRAGMLFAQDVLLVEGPSETALINRLIDDGRLVLPKGTYVLDCLGKYNIHRFMNLLSQLGVTHAVLHDDDDNANEHEALAQLIAESAHATFTRKIVPIPKQLENFLGLKPAKLPHRKPQHILYCYAAQLIADDRLAAFTELVETCFRDTKLH